MEILKEKHKELKKLEEAKLYALHQIDEYNFLIDSGKASILSGDTKIDWKGLGITNQAGRDAYIKTMYENQLEELKKLKSTLRYIEVQEKQVKRVINYYMKYGESNEDITSQGEES